MGKTLICTAGTSLYSNFTRERQQNDEICEIFKRFEDQNFIGFSKELLKMDETERLLGAEISSIYHLLNKKKEIEIDKILFLVSETELGKHIGETLSLYYNSSAYNQSKKKDFADYKIVEKLNDENPTDFKNHGLRNLVKEISQEVKSSGTDNVVINSTGGYKAQTLFAGVIGQSLGIPVYYLFERFNEIIELPPQPISFDPEFWFENQGTFYSLERGGYVGEDFAQEWFDSKDSRFDSLMIIEKENDKKFLMFSPTGEMFHQAFITKYASNLTSLPEDSPKQEAPHLTGDHHRPKGIEQYLNKLTSQFLLN